jgi:hypothetical protein
MPGTIPSGPDETAAFFSGLLALLGVAAAKRQETRLRLSVLVGR